MINLIMEEKKRPIHIWTGAAKKIMVSIISNFSSGGNLGGDNSGV